MSAATVVISSAEGAGDMPSSAPVASDDTSQAGAPAFSEVLSRSSSEQSGSPDAPDAPTPPDSAADSDDTRVQAPPAATAVPVTPKGAAATKTGASTRDGTGRSGAQAHGPANPSEHGASPPGRAAGSPVPSAPGGADPIPLATSTPRQDEGAATDSAGSPSSAPPTAASATPPPSELAVPPPSGPETPQGPLLAGSPAEPLAAPGSAPTAPDGQSPPASGRKSTEHLPLGFDAGSVDDGNRAEQARVGATEAGRTDVRDSAEPDSEVLRAGAARTEVSGSAANDPTLVLTPSALSTAGTATSRSTGASTQELAPSAAFPDVEGGAVASGVDLGDLAASISRPLAAGSGDYSVQVSLHPPELGQVRALLSLQGDVLHVTLTPEHASGFDALSDALPTLHDQLAGGGIEVHVSLGQPGDQPGGDDQPAVGTASVTGAPSDDADQAPSLPAVSISSGDPGRIHLIL